MSVRRQLRGFPFEPFPLLQQRVQPLDLRPQIDLDAALDPPGIRLQPPALDCYRRPGLGQPRLNLVVSTTQTLRRFQPTPERPLPHAIFRDPLLNRAQPIPLRLQIRQRLFQRRDTVRPCAQISRRFCQLLPPRRQPLRFDSDGLLLRRQKPVQAVLAHQRAGQAAPPHPGPTPDACTPPRSPALSQSAPPTSQPCPGTAPPAPAHPSSGSAPRLSGASTRPIPSSYPPGRTLRD